MNVGFSASVASSAAANAGQGDFVLTGGGKGLGSGSQGWVVWAVVGLVAVAALFLFFKR